MEELDWYTRSQNFSHLARSQPDIVHQGRETIFNGRGDLVGRQAGVDSPDRLSGGPPL